jgi:hypothetical protein
MSAIPQGAQSVMAGRREPPDALDFFPTPPWATRALLYDVLLPRRLAQEWMTCGSPPPARGT